MLTTTGARITGARCAGTIGARLFLGAILALLWVLLPVHDAAASVAPGDIAIIGYRSDNPDAIAFVVLEPIPAGEVIRFTDSGWKTTGSFRTNEGGVEFTAGAELSPGTVVSRDAPFDTGEWNTNSDGLGGNAFALSTDGDQVLVFQGDAGSPVFVYALQNNSSGWSTASDARTTALPPGLSDGVTAVNVGSPEYDNAFYDGLTIGTAEEILAAIGDPANWVGGDSAQSWPAWSFDVGSIDRPAIAGIWLSDSAFDPDDEATVSVSLDEAPPVGTPAVVTVASGAFSVSPVTVEIENPDVVGTVNVIMANPGMWTATANPVSGCTGSATSSSFSVASGPVAPVAYAGADRGITLSGSSVADLMTGATATDANGFDGLTYEWTPAVGTGIVGWSLRTGAVSSADDPAGAQVILDAVGVYTFTLTVSDPTSRVDTDTMILTVSEPVQTDEYDPPASYYDPARPGGSWYTGSTLKNALHGIIDNHTSRSYDNAIYAIALLDKDPDNPSNIILMYNGWSVSGTWGSGWNREHMWPDSLNSNATDLVNIRPCTPSVNSARGNKVYGEDAGEWDANQGFNHRGESARTMFYMATRYSNLTLVVGNHGGSGSNEMGDLTDLLAWHYETPVSPVERRRNHLLYDSSDNPDYYQGNRNPLVDHPELVWSIWGGGSNNSKLYVGVTPPSDGASSQTVDLGTIIKNAAVPSPQVVTLHKTGADPTTYTITENGDAVASPVGRRFAFAGGTHSLSISAGLTGLTVVPGMKTGSIIVDNTDITSAGVGCGSADGDDSITVQLAVKDHSEASFSGSVDQDALTVEFGAVSAGTGIFTQNLAIHNLVSTPSFTAGLDIDSIVPSGDTGALFADLVVCENLVAGGQLSHIASFDSNVAPGLYETTYALSVSDEDIPGTLAGATLTLTLLGEVLLQCNPVDANCVDGVTDDDISAFVSLLLDAADPCYQCPDCTICAGDVNGDGELDGADIAAFVSAIVGG